MNNEKFSNAVTAQMKRSRDVLIDKGKEYGNNADRLAHFRKAAALQDTTEQDALYGMLSKHLVSVAEMCGTGDVQDYPKSLWDEKITDSINYFLILAAIVADKKEGYIL